ncbi:DUF6192 family protein [Streptomyces spectabilis]|uniref:DUF6192 family protein n=1 Tax=Streptomyces spectabilis TaxID=68270 RepID=UPI0033FC0C88
MVGSVSRQRYEEIVAELREAVEHESGACWLVGDRALEVEPMRPRGGRQAVLPGEVLLSVRESLFMLAEDVGLSYGTVESRRWTASRWPAERRRVDLSYTIHRTLAHIEDERERFAAIHHPPEHPGTGRRVWTPDQANRRVGFQVARPVSQQEKINAIHTLARDDEVASKVTTDMLRRPDVAFRAMRDDTARHQVNDAQVEQARQIREAHERELLAGGEPPLAPAVRRVTHAIEFLDLVSNCHAFVAKASRVVPHLRDRHLSDDECAVIHSNVSRVRATCDWIDHAVQTGQVDVDEELARLLRGE